MTFRILLGVPQVESLIWNCFDYNEQTGKLKCYIVGVQTGMEGSTLLAGEVSLRAELPVFN